MDIDITPIGYAINMEIDNPDAGKRYIRYDRYPQYWA